MRPLPCTTKSSTEAILQAVFDSLGHQNVLVNGRLEQGPVALTDGDLIEVRSIKVIQFSVWGACMSRPFHIAVFQRPTQH